MKLEKAIELGKSCGLLTVPECVNNVLMHVANLFVYSEAEAETTELIKEADAAGVKFCASCGAAMNQEGVCYMKGLLHKDPV